MIHSAKHIPGIYQVRRLSHDTHDIATPRAKTAQTTPHETPQSDTKSDTESNTIREGLHEKKHAGQTKRFEGDQGLCSTLIHCTCTSLEEQTR